jgi:hypothetical protein
MNRFKKLNKIQKRIIIILFLLLILVISLFAATNRNKDKESQAIVESEMLERYVLCSAPLDQTIINTINNPIKFNDITPSRLDDYSKNKKEEYSKISNQVKNEKEKENSCIQKIIDDKIVEKVSTEDIRIKLANLLKRRQIAVQKIDESYSQLDKFLLTLNDYINFLKKDNIAEAAKLMGALINIDQSKMENMIKENSDKGEADNVIAKYAGDTESNNLGALAEMKNTSVDIKEAINKIS